MPAAAYLRATLAMGAERTATAAHVLPCRTRYPSARRGPAPSARANPAGPTATAIQATDAKRAYGARPPAEVARRSAPAQPASAPPRAASRRAPRPRRSARIDASTWQPIRNTAAAAAQPATRPECLRSRPAPQEYAGAPGLCADQPVRTPRRTRTTAARAVLPSSYPPTVMEHARHLNGRSRASPGGRSAAEPA
jgi:hypothetical protein